MILLNIVEAQPKALLLKLQIPNFLLIPKEDLRSKQINSAKLVITTLTWLQRPLVEYN